MFSKQIMKNWTKNVTRQIFYTVFSNMFEFNEFFYNSWRMQITQNFDKLKIIKRNINQTQVLDTQSSFPSLKKVIIGRFYSERY